MSFYKPGVTRILYLARLASRFVTAWSGGPSVVAQEKESARPCVAGQWACGVLTSGPKDAGKGAARGRRVLVVDRSAGRGCGVRTQCGCLPGGDSEFGSRCGALRMLRPLIRGPRHCCARGCCGVAHVGSLHVCMLCDHA